MLFLREPENSDRDEVLAAYERSRELHNPWVFPPDDIDRYLGEDGRYFLCLETTGDIVGTFQISGVIRGCFHSAFLGYAAFAPFHGKRYMARGLRLLLEDAFEELNLHRVEANIQPQNVASVRLVAGAGFVKEGYSRQYLRIGGEWQDHERWAIINPAWRE